MQDVGCDPSGKYYDMHPDKGEAPNEGAKQISNTLRRRPAF
jgi:hypothetical protein